MGLVVGAEVANSEADAVGAGVFAAIPASASGGVGVVVVPSGGDANPETSKTMSLLAA